MVGAWIDECSFYENSQLQEISHESCGGNNNVNEVLFGCSKEACIIIKKAKSKCISSGKEKVRKVWPKNNF